MDTMTTDQILEGIAAMQKVQMTNPYWSENWQRASKVLDKLFAEMAKRSKSQ